jgi:hypothetical protein
MAVANQWKCPHCNKSNAAVERDCTWCVATKAKRQQVDQAYRLAVKHTSLASDNDDTLRGFIMGFRFYERMATAMDQALTPEQISRFKGM